MTHRLLDPWTRLGLVVTVAPLLLWGGIAVTRLTEACHVSWWIAWIPAVATAGVMLASTKIAMTLGLDARIRRNAGWLAAWAIVADIAATGASHYLESQLAAPPGWMVTVIGGLPSLMGGALVHVIASISAQRRRELADAERARVAAEQAAADVAAAQSERERAEAADRARRAVELDHQRELAAGAARAATENQRAADEAGRLAAAQRAAASAVDEALKPPPDLRLVRRQGTKTAPKASAGRAPLRDAALRYLAEQHAAGADIDDIGPSALARAIGARPGYGKKEIAEWREQVRTHAEREETG